MDQNPNAIEIFHWNFWFYACDQKLILVTFYVKPYLSNWNLWIFSTIPLTFLDTSYTPGRSNFEFKNVANSWFISLASLGGSGFDFETFGLFLGLFSGLSEKYEIKIMIKNTPLIM